MDKPTVSVIIPVYNSEKYLKKCLDSIVNQTLKNIEIIIINDGSNDNSEDIVKSYKDTRIKYIAQENKGVSAARNLGMDIATGKYISFIDSDDWVDLDFLEKLYTTAEKYNADIAVAGIIRDRNNRIKSYLKFENEIITNDKFQKLSLCDVPEISYVWNKLYKSSSLKKINLKFEKNRIYEDVLFTPQVLIKLDKLVTVPNTYYYRFRRKGSLVSLTDKKSKSDFIYMKKESEKYMKSHGIDITLLKPIIKKYGILGLTFFKIRTKGHTKEYRLFNVLIKKENLSDELSL
jgi:glycosyltransferase involved in cell wall biosynthesis